MHDTQECERGQTSHLNAKSLPKWKHGKCLDGTLIKLDVNNGVYTMDMWICLDETGPVFQLAGTVSGQAAFDKPARPAALCRGGDAEVSQVEEVESKEFEWS